MDEPEACRRQRAAVVSTALDQAARDPAARFTMEACQYLQEILEDMPERRDEILALTRAGRLDWGASWNQPYESLVSGEQLVRQVLLGRGWAARQFGFDLVTAMNADVPCRAWQWPQILARAGVRYLYSGRHVPGCYRWHSPDGSSVFAWNGGHYNWHWSSYLKHGTKVSAEALARHLPEWLGNPAIVAGDGQLLPIAVMCDASMPVDLGPLRDLLNNNGLVEAREATFTEAFEALSHRARPVDVQGERPNGWLYIHGPGHARAVSDQRAAARLLPQVEMVACLLEAHRLPSQTTADTRAKAWRDAMAADHGWGGKGGTVTDAAFAAGHARARLWADYRVTSGLEQVANTIAESDEGRGVLIWNGLPWERGGLVRWPLRDEKPVHLRDREGRAIPAEIITEGGQMYLLARVVRVPAMGWTTLFIHPGHPPASAVPDCAPVSVMMSEQGEPVIFDRAQNATLSAVGFGTVFHMQSNGDDIGVEQTPYGHDWKPGAPSGEGRAGTENSTWVRIHEGPLVSRYRSITTLPAATVVRLLEIDRATGAAELRVDLQGWTGERRREWRVNLSLAPQRAELSYDVAFGQLRFGVDECQIAPPVPLQGPREVQDSISVKAGDGSSLSIAVPDTPVCDLSADGSRIEPILLASRKSCHPEGPWYSQPGDHSFRFIIAPSKNGKPSWQQGLEGTTPLRLVMPTKPAKGRRVPYECGLLELRGTGAHAVQITAVKPAEDGAGWIVRLCEMAGQRAKVMLHPALHVRRADRVSPIETRISSLDVCADGTVPVELEPHAIETIWLDVEFPAP